jgi:hypothetical protein
MRINMAFWTHYCSSENAKVLLPIAVECKLCSPRRSFGHRSIRNNEPSETDMLVKLLKKEKGNKNAV